MPTPIRINGSFDPAGAVDTDSAVGEDGPAVDGVV